MFLLVGLVLGLAVGAVAAWVVSRSRLESTRAIEAAENTSETERTRAEAERLRAEAERAKGESERTRADMEQLRGRIAEAQAEAASAREEAALALKAEADARAEVRAQIALVDTARAEAAAAQAQAKALGEDRENLVAQFKLLSQETMDRQSKAADATAAERLKATEQLVAPVAQALQQFQERLTAVEKERAALHAELRGEVRAVQKAGDDLRRETHALANALRKPQARGAWGETQLRRVAEIAGMVNRVDFLEQNSVRYDDALFRPDMTVNLAGGKQIFVDSKVPLSAWLEAGDLDDDAERGAFLTTFGRTVKSHVDALGSKNYWQMTETMSPEFVVMFLPGESFLHAALDADPDLLDYASRRNVVIATPTTLIALLRTVALGWKQAELTESARQVFELGRELYTRLATMGGHVSTLGKALNKAMESYNATVGALEGRVMVTARKLNNLDFSDKELPALTASDKTARGLTAAEFLQPELEAGPTEEDLLRRPEPDNETLALEGAVLPLERRRDIG